MYESEKYCLFCQIVLNAEAKVDIQFTTTKEGNVNVEQFIKESVLGIHVKSTLEGQFLCNLCYHTLNQLEEYLMKSRDIQDKLRDLYILNQASVKQELFNTDVCFKEQISGDNRIQISNNHSNKLKHKPEKGITNQESSVLIQISQERKCVQLAMNSGDSVVPAVIHEIYDEKQKEKWCCEICGKVTNKSNAAKHMNIHTKKYLFVCEYCNKNFTQKVDLRRHINIHMGIFPYVCEFCGKKFAQHASYDIHKKNHLGKRDFKCVVCDKALLSKSHLIRHMKTHTSEKNFSCEICGKTFAEKYNMNSHIKKVHMKEEPPAEHKQSFKPHVIDTVEQNVSIV